MKRCLLIFLLMLLPLQFSWAAVAALCQHDKESNTQHFGHHDSYGHAQAEQNTSDKLQQDNQDDTSNNDNDSDSNCQFCHLSCNKQVGVHTGLLPLMTVQNSFPSAPPASYLSHIGESPEKPDWLHLA